MGSIQDAMRPKEGKIPGA